MINIVIQDIVSNFFCRHYCKIASSKTVRVNKYYLMFPFFYKCISVWKITRRISNQVISSPISEKFSAYCLEEDKRSTDEVLL